MCAGGECPQKAHCLRFTAVVTGRQDFFGLPPYLNSQTACGFFLDDRPSQAAIRLQAYLLWEKGGNVHGKSIDYWHQAEVYLLELKRKGG